MKKIIILVIVIVVSITTIVIAALNGYYNKPNENPDVPQIAKVKVNEVTRSVFYAPQYVALSKGFFKAENIEVELTTGQGADKVMTAVLAGQSDIGFAGPEASIYVYNEGKEDFTQVFAQMTQKDGSFFISREEIDNFKWSDVKGKTIIPGRKGGVPYMALEYVLKQNGIVPGKDVTLDDSIKFDLMAGAFAGGNADFVTLFEPTASMTQNAGKGYIVASVGEAAGEIPYTAYFAKKSYIESNPDLIKRFTKAIYQGQIWVKNHSAKEIAAEIVSFFPDSNLELLETVINRYKEIDVWSQTPVLNQESFNLLQTVMESAGELKQRAPYDKVVNNSFAQQVLQ